MSNVTGWSRGLEVSGSGTGVVSHAGLALVLPPGFRRRLMITCDGAGASHDLVRHLDTLAARPGHQLIYPVGWALGGREKTALRLVPEQAWQIAVDGRGEIRERRAEDACGNGQCAHRACWTGERVYLKAMYSRRTALFTLLGVVTRRVVPRGRCRVG